MKNNKNDKLKKIMIMNTKKFWCHYIGSDGNTPKRRSIELTDIHELLPNVSNEGAKTPVWVDKVEDNDGYRTNVHYYLYAQLSDQVAVSTLMYGVYRDYDIEQMRMSDADIEADGLKRLQNHLAVHPEYDSDRIAKEREYFTGPYVDGIKKTRDRHLAQIRNVQDYNNFLLSGASWISTATLRAYEEAGSPILSGLKEIRAIKMEEREAEAKRRQEEAQKRREEEARKKAEEDRQERERLIVEAEKFKNGESIAGGDVVELCRRCGINIHLRTVHNLQQVIANINGTGQCQYYRTRGKRRPQLDGCYETAVKLYKHLQEHCGELVNYMKMCNNLTTTN